MSTNSSASKLNGTLLSGLGTGLLKNTTGTGAPSIAANTDLPVMSATVGGAVPTPPNNTTTFLRGDGTFATPAGSGTVGTLNVNTTGVGNVGIGEDNLITYSVAGNTLAANNDYLTADTAGTFAASINNKRLRAYFGSTLIFDSGSLAITVATDWKGNIIIIRTSATTFTAAVVISTSSATLSAYADYSTGTETLANALVLKMTGEGTADNDVRQEWMITKLNSATTDALLAYATLTGVQTLTNKTLTSPVINTPTGIVKGDVGLGSVDNTSDVNKPVSTAQQTALNLKANLASPTFTGTVVLPSGQALIAPSLGVATATSINGVELNSISDMFPIPPLIYTGTSNSLSSNITMQVMRFSVSDKITFTKLYVRSGVVTVVGTAKFAIYSESGSTKLAEATSPNFASNTLNTVTFSSTTLQPGHYYIAVLSQSTFNASFSLMALVSGSSVFLQDIAGKANIMMKYTVTADTIPSTIDPTAGTTSGAIFPIVRLSS